MKALVTGANGHVGAALVRELLRRGVPVRALVRKNADVRSLEGLDVEKVHGDVLDADSLVPAAQGCEVVYHTAAVYTMWAKDPAEIVKPAVEGARNMFAAAGKAGVRRMVYTSSAAAVGTSDAPGVVRTEKDWNTDYKNPYYQAKTESERIAHQLAAEHGVPVVVVNPVMVLGPGDWRITPSTQNVRDLLTGAVPVFDGGYALVHVDDVAKGHVLAAEKGVPGERYLLTSVNLTVQEYADALRKRFGHGSTRRIPLWALRGLASASTALSKLTGGKPMISKDTIDEVAGRWMVYDNTKARTQLGWDPQCLDPILTDTVRWLVEREQLPPKLLADLAPKVRQEGVRAAS
jgi:dihydroflavonol-4-reductase